MEHTKIQEIKDWWVKIWKGREYLTIKEGDWNRLGEAWIEKVESALQQGKKEGKREALEEAEKLQRIIHKILLWANKNDPKLEREINEELAKASLEDNQK